MKRTLYLGDYQTSEYRNGLKILMQKLGVGIDDESKFNSNKAEQVILTVTDPDILTILDNMNDCDYIVCR